MKKYIIIVEAIVIVGLGFFLIYPPSVEPEVITEIITEECEVGECPVVESVVYEDVEKIVYRDVIKEVVKEIEVIKEIPVEKIVYKECKKETSEYLEVRSFSTYPQSESMKFFVTTNLITDSALQIYPANPSIRYSSVRTTEHVLQANKLIPGIKYHYKITFTTKEGLSMDKEGEFIAN